MIARAFGNGGDNPNLRICGSVSPATPSKYASAVDRAHRAQYLRRMMMFSAVLRLASGGWPHD